MLCFVHACFGLCLLLALALPSAFCTNQCTLSNLLLLDIDGMCILANKKVTFKTFSNQHIFKISIGAPYGQKDDVKHDDPY
jgi:hypothetical protein